MDKIVLICATGRSGSTTMQRIINIIPNSNICGENFGAINSLLEFYKRIKTTTIEYVPGHLKPASYKDIISHLGSMYLINFLYQISLNFFFIKLLVLKILSCSDFFCLYFITNISCSHVVNFYRKSKW